jgi:type VI secretion system secreted protein VgrG
VSAIFDKAFDYAMRNEGHSKYTNDPDDRGGPTKWGITLATMKAGGHDLDLDGDVDADDVKLIDESLAKSIYHNRYWQPIHADKIQSERIAIKLFDHGVNMGPAKASRIAQEALNEFGYGLVADGKIGPVTLNALNTVDEDQFLLMVTTKLIDFYRSLNQPKFIKGWTNRAKRLP